MPPLRSGGSGGGGSAPPPEEEYLYPGGAGNYAPAAPAPAYDSAAAYDAAQYEGGNAYSTGTPAAEQAWAPVPYSRIPPPSPMNVTATGRGGTDPSYGANSYEAQWGRFSGYDDVERGRARR